MGRAGQDGEGGRQRGSSERDRGESGKEVYWDSAMSEAFDGSLDWIT